MTIANAGLPLVASARKYPADAHDAYRFCSTSPGWYWAGSWSADAPAGVRISEVSVTLRVYESVRTSTHARPGVRTVRVASGTYARASPIEENNRDVLSTRWTSRAVPTRR